MNIRCLVQTLFLGVVIILLSSGIAHAEYDFPKDPELERAIADTFGDFDPDTETANDCRIALPNFKKAISRGIFDRSKDYLSRAYVHQGMLLMCIVSKDPTLPDAEVQEIWDSMLSSFTRAQQLVPHADAPYFVLGMSYVIIGGAKKSVEDYQTAENYLIKALQISPSNDLYQSALDEVRQLIPGKRTPGFKPIPFE